MRPRILALAAVLTAAALSSAHASVSEKQFEAETQRIDASADNNPEERNVWILSRAFDTPPSVARNLFDGIGTWGGTSLRMAIGESMVKGRPDEFPFVEDAVKALEDVPMGGPDWMSAVEAMGAVSAGALDRLAGVRREFAEADPFIPRARAAAQPKKNQTPAP